MAKKNGKGKSAKLLGPLRESGRMNGPASGVPHPQATPDPMGYLSKTGQSAPGGSPSDRVQQTGRGDRDQSPDARKK